MATIKGTKGNDLRNGTSGKDTINGLAGNDVLNGLGGRDVINGGAGHDTINGGAGNDTLNGGAGNDTIIFSTGYDTYDGGEGFDTLDFSQASGSIIFTEAADPGPGTELPPGYGVTIVNNVERFVGSNFNDEFDLDFIAHAVTVEGGLGNDTIGGGAGSDTLNGGDGTDTAVFSGARDDYVVVDNGDGTVTLSDNRDGSPDGSDTITAFENVEFSDGTLTLAQLLGLETYSTVQYQGDNGQGLATGTFYEIDDNSWVEVGSDGTQFFFEETSETANGAVLFDDDRDVTVTFNYQTNDMTVSFPGGSLDWDITSVAHSNTPPTSSDFFL